MYNTVLYYAELISIYAKKSKLSSTSIPPGKRSVTFLNHALYLPQSLVHGLTYVGLGRRSYRAYCGSNDGC